MVELVPTLLRQELARLAEDGQRMLSLIHI